MTTNNNNNNNNKSNDDKMNNTSSFSTFELEKYFSKYEFCTRYLCCCSDCESLSIGELLEMDNGRNKGNALDELLNISLGYTEASGSPALRLEIAKLYQNTSHDGKTLLEMDASDILVHSGGVEPILLFVLTCIPHDSHIIVQGPCYQALSEPARVKGIEQSFWNIKRSENRVGSWYFDLEELQKLIQPNTRALILNPIHNPTGWIPTRDELDTIVSIARKHHLILYSDEVYRYLEYNEQDKSLPHMCQLYENAISMNVLSKSFGLAGLRIGWIATKNKTILEKISRGKDYTTICNAAPSEYLSIIALRNRDTIHKRNNEIIQKNILIAEEFFSKYSHLFEWRRPASGPICLVRYKGSEGAYAFCEKIVHDAGVMLLPSVTYGYEDCYFRLGLGRRNLPEALHHLGEYLQAQEQPPPSQQQLPPIHRASAPPPPPPPPP
jgi:aspartate/methionine/tyrosine aminotransferase